PEPLPADHHCGGGNLLDGNNTIANEHGPGRASQILHRQTPRSRELTRQILLPGITADGGSTRTAFHDVFHELNGASCNAYIRIQYQNVGSVRTTDYSVHATSEAFVIAARVIRDPLGKRNKKVRRTVRRMIIQNENLHVRHTKHRLDTFFKQTPR